MRDFKLSQIADLSMNGEIAIFDFDGTILTGDCSEEMFKDLMERELLTSANLIRAGLMPEGESLSPMDYYNKLLSEQGDEEYVMSHLWMVRALAGIKLKDLLTSSAVAFEEERLGFETQVLEILDTCQKKQAKCYILSASPQIVVRYLTQKYLNPYLEKKRMEQIPLENVFGIEMKFDSAPDFSIALNEICWEENFSLKPTTEILFPAPSGVGKSHFIKQYLPSKPTLSVSDSETDLPLLRDSHFGILFNAKNEGARFQLV